MTCARSVVNRMRNIVKKANNIEELLASCPPNQVIGNNLVLAWAKINEKPNPPAVLGRME